MSTRRLAWVAWLIAATASNAAAADAAARVHCEVIYGGEIFPVVSQPTQQPYRVEGTKIGRYFEFKIVHVTAPAAYPGIDIYTYALSTGEPVLIHQARYAPPYHQGKHRYGFTGLNAVYEPSKSSEMQYWCELR